MAPLLSKPVPPLQHSTDIQYALAYTQRQAKPILECLLGIVQSSLKGAGVAWDQARLVVSQIGEHAAKNVEHMVRQTVLVLQTYCCLDLQRYTRGRDGPKLQSSLPILFVLMLLMMLYNAFVFAYMPAAGIHFTSRISMIFHSFVFLVLSSFVQAVRTDPGAPPQEERWSTEGKPPPEAKQHKRGTQEARWCRKSGTYKPDRAHYCRVLGRVVLRMDHHCPWLGNTVGFANHKFFLLFLAYASSACGLLGVGILDLLVHATLPALSTFMLIGAEWLTGLLSSILVPFFLFHFWLLARNQTTIEFVETMQSSTETGGDDGEATAHQHSYDLGFFENVKAVMGENPLLWFVPVGGPSGDGLNFETQAEQAKKAAAEAEAQACCRRRAKVKESPADAEEVEGCATPLEEPEAAHPKAYKLIEPTDRESSSDHADGRPEKAATEERSSDHADERPEKAATEEWSSDHADGRPEKAAAEEWSSDHADGRPETAATEEHEEDVKEKRSAFSCGEDFLVWEKAEDFTDDLRLGCEFLGDAVGSVALAVAKFCARGRLPDPRASRQSLRKKQVRIADDVRDSSASDSGHSSRSGRSGGSARSQCSDFLSDCQLEVKVAKAGGG